MEKEKIIERLNEIISLAQSQASGVKKDEYRYAVTSGALTGLLQVFIKELEKETK